MRDGIPHHEFEAWKKFAETESSIRKCEAGLYQKKY